MTSTETGAGTAAGSGPPGLVLAIDAGNSKTDVAVVAADGRVTGAARGGGFRPPAVALPRGGDRRPVRGGPRFPLIINRAVAGKRNA